MTINNALTCKGIRTSMGNQRWNADLEPGSDKQMLSQWNVLMISLHSEEDGGHEGVQVDFDL